MKNSKKRLFVIALVLSIITTMAGCGGSQNISETSDSKTEVKGSTDTSAIAADPFGKYTPEIKMTVALPKIDPSWMKLPEGQTVEDNIWTRTYKEELGINTEIVWSTTSDKAAEKVNMMIASNDLPDLMRVNLKQFKMLADADKLADLTDVAKQYASPFVKANILSEANKAPIDRVTVDGKMKGLVYNVDNIDSTKVMWIRADWLKKLNLQAPKTIDELTAVAKAFITNGAKYGISLPKDLKVPGLYNAFHTYPAISAQIGNENSYGFWIDNGSGRLVDGKLLPAMRTQLSTMQQWYKDGIIAKDFGVADGSKLDEDLISGKVGIRFDGIWSISSWQALKDNNKDADLISYPLPSIDSTPAKVGVSASNIQDVWCVRKGYEHPEAAIKILNIGQKYLFTPETLDTEKYCKTSQGSHQWAYSLNYTEPRRKNFDIYAKIKEAIQTGDSSILNTEQKIYYDSVVQYEAGDNKAWNVYRNFAPEGSSFAVNDYYISNNSFQTDAFDGFPTESMIEKGPTLTKLWDEMVTRIIMGASDISEFDKYLDRAKSLGQTEIENEVNEWYASKNK